MLVLASLIAAQTVALAIQPPVGLTDVETTESQAKLAAELKALGVEITPAGAVDPACVPDAACVERARAEAAVPALLVVELVRVGPVVQLTATGSSGEKHATGSHGLDAAQLKKGPLLPKAVRQWAKGLAAPAPAPPPPPPEVKQQSAPFELTPIRSGALFAGGVGAIALVAGAILIGTSEPVLEDPTSLGPAKEQAAALGWVGIGGTVLGVAGLSGAVGLFLLDPDAAPPAGS